jgi:FRG domain
METRRINSWKEIQILLEEIHLKYSKTVIDEYPQSHLILYRGLTDSNWQLNTTLERQSDIQWTLASYYLKIFFCAPQIESFLGTSWNLGAVEDIERNVAKAFKDFTVILPHYEYWAYLRHHGFPSPLLDWTKSPYIALFFALCDQSNAEFASIYAYIECPEGSKGGIVGAPMITVQHPYVKTHKRHFLQQSYYTVATKILNVSTQEHVFIPHEQVFNEDHKDQDLLIKIEIPRSLRLDVLAKLHLYNINFYSLFQTEDALMRSLALKELELSFAEL